MATCKKTRAISLSFTKKLKLEGRGMFLNPGVRPKKVPSVRFK